MPDFLTAVSLVGAHNYSPTIPQRVPNFLSALRRLISVALAP